MALIDKHTVRFVSGGIFGAGALLLWPYMGPVLSAVTRPLLKSIIRQSVVGLAHGRERIVRATEALEDLIAEVRTELDDDQLRIATDVAATASAKDARGSEPSRPGESN